MIMIQSNEYYLREWQNAFCDAIERYQFTWGYDA